MLCFHMCDVRFNNTHLMGAKKKILSPAYPAYGWRLSDWPCNADDVPPGNSAQESCGDIGWFCTTA